ncbi:MAG: histidine phosphatase family protein [Deltaproteobacteria bacterium]|nr:histidine phosphatase family protein [Deltaproteobacteria bacterium]
MKKIMMATLLVLAVSIISFQETIAGSLKEDCVSFNPDKVQIKLINKSWKIIEGSHWIMDFGLKSNEAAQALQIIKKYGYNQICFVGRPKPSMTYFRKKPRNTTKVFIVRHAEKAGPSGDPPLTAIGEKRAATLARILDKSGVSVVFSTNTTRTRETVNNYADPRRIRIQLYGSIPQLTNLVTSTYVGKNILVAGHSDTVPATIRALGVGSAPEIGNEFNNLFIVTLAPDGSASLTWLKYEIHHDLY